MPLPPGDTSWIGTVSESDPAKQQVPESEVPAERSWPRAAADTALSLGQVAPDLVRAISTTGRAIADDPHGLWAQFDRSVARPFEEWYGGMLSPRGKEISAEKWMPGVDDTSAWRDLPAKVAETGAGFIPFLAAGLVTGGVGFALNFGGMAATQLGSYNKELYDYFDKASSADMKKAGIPWEQVLHDAGGDELKARNDLFKKSYDALAAGANTLAGGVAGLGLGGKAGIKAISGLLPRVGAASAEGGALGFAQGAAGQYGRERTAINLGLPTDGSSGERIAQAGAESMVPMVGGAVAGNLRGHKAEIVNGPSAAQAAALNAQLNPTTVNPPPPPPPPPPPSPPSLAGPAAVRGPLGAMNARTQQAYPPPGTPPPAVRGPLGSPSGTRLPSTPPGEVGTPGAGEGTLDEYAKTLPAPPPITPNYPAQPAPPVRGPLGEMGGAQAYPASTAPPEVRGPLARPSETRLSSAPPGEVGTPGAGTEGVLAEYAKTLPPTPPTASRRPRPGEGGGEPPPNDRPPPGPAGGGGGGGITLSDGTVIPDFTELPASPAKPPAAKKTTKKAAGGEGITLSDGTVVPDFTEMAATPTKAEQAKKTSKKRSKKDKSTTETAPEVTPEVTPPASFTTAKGSTYEVHDDGSTTRTKAARAEHPGDSGEKPKSERTVYIDPETAREVGMWQTSSAKGKRIDIVGDEIRLTSLNLKTGKRGIDRTINSAKFTDTPEVGKSPLELWKKDKEGRYAGNHPGNPITEVAAKETERQPLTGTLSIGPKGMEAVATAAKRQAEQRKKFTAGHYIKREIVLERGKVRPKPDLNEERSGRPIQSDQMDSERIARWAATQLRKALVLKPKDFDSQEARLRRFEGWVPVEWDQFKNEARKAFRAGDEAKIQNLAESLAPNTVKSETGEAHSEQRAANLTRRQRIMADREKLAQAALQFRLERMAHKQLTELLEAATHDIGAAKGLANAKAKPLPGDKFPDMTGDKPPEPDTKSRAYRRSQQRTPEGIVDTAIKVHDLLTDQINRAYKAFETYKKENRQRGKYEEGKRSGDNIMELPRPQRGRSAKEGNDWHSRLAHYRLIEDRLNKMLRQAGYAQVDGEWKLVGHGSTLGRNELGLRVNVATDLAQTMTRDEEGRVVPLITAMRSMLNEWRNVASVDVETARMTKRAKAAELTESGLTFRPPRKAASEEEIQAHQEAIDNQIHKALMTLGRHNASESEIMEMAVKEVHELFNNVGEILALPKEKQALRVRQALTEILDELPKGPEGAGQRDKVVGNMMEELAAVETQYGGKQKIKEAYQEILATDPEQIPHGPKGKALRDKAMRNAMRELAAAEKQHGGMGDEEVFGFVKAAMDKVRTETEEQTEAERAATERELKRTGYLVPADLPRQLMEVDAIGSDAANHLHEEGGNATGYIIKVRDHMNRRLADIFRVLAAEIPSRNTDFLRMARRAETSTERPTEAIKQLIEVVNGPGEAPRRVVGDPIEAAVEHYGTSDAEHYASNEAKDAIAKWLADRDAADRTLQDIETWVPRGMDTPSAANDALPTRNLTAAEIKALWKRTPKGEAEPPPQESPEVKEYFKARQTLERLVAEKKALETVPRSLQAKIDQATDRLRRLDQDVSRRIKTLSAFEPEPTPPKIGVTPEVTPSERLARNAADVLSDPKSSPEELAARINDHEIVDIKSVKDVSNVMTHRGNALDEHFRDIARKIVPGVPVIHLHDDIYDALMKKVAPDQADSDGYYDALSDRIFIRAKVADLRHPLGADRYRALLKHEVGHAMALSALETNPVARGRLQEIMKLVGQSRSWWEQGLGESQANRIESTLRDVHEFVSEVWANHDFRRLLAGVPLPKGDAVRLQTPEAKTVLESFVSWVKKAVGRMFKTYSDDNALNASLIQSMDLFSGLAEKGRPALQGEKTGAAGKLEDLLKEKYGDMAERIRYRWNRRNPGDPTSRGWGQRGLWAHTSFDLTQRGEPGFREKTRDVHDAVAELKTSIDRSAINRPVEFTSGGRRYRISGDDEFLREHAKFAQAPQADKAYELMVRETMHGAFVDDQLGIGRNAHIKPGQLVNADTVLNHPDMMRRHAEMVRNLPGYERIRDMTHAWGKEIRRLTMDAQLRDVAGKDDVTLDASGNRDPTAVSAFAKFLMHEPLTPAEQAWIDRQRPDIKGDTDALLQKAKFDKLVGAYRQAVPELRNLKGPYVPLKRHGGFAISGEYQLPEIDSAKGRDLGDGYKEFYSEQDARDYIAEVQRGANTKLLNAEKFAYVKDPNAPRADWKEAQREAESTTFEGGPVNEPGFIATVRRAVRRVSAAAAEKDPDLEVRHRLHYNIKHFEGFDSEAKAAARIKELEAEGVKMSPNVELFRQAIDAQSPHFMSQAMRTLMNRAKNSVEYKRMTLAERKAWESRLNTEAARAVLAAGGRAPGLPREFVEGASTNMIESLGEASAQSAMTLAHARHGAKLHDAFAALEEYVEDRKRSVGNDLRDAVSHELAERAYTVQDPFVQGIWGAATNRLLQMTYTAKLAGTSFLMINLLEPILLGLPVLAGKFGAWKSISNMRQAYRDLSGLKILGAGFNDMVNAARNRTGNWTDFEETIEKNIAASGAKDVAEVTQMFKVLAERGLFDRSAMNELSLLKSPTTSRTGKALDWIDNTFRGMNNSVEVLNRGVLALAAFRMARGTMKERITAAEDAVYRGAGVYSAWNAPPIFNHPVARLALQFKKYPQRIMSNYIEAVVGSLQGDTKKMSQLAYMLGTQAMVAGLFGLPTEIFSAPVNAMNMASGGATPNWEDIQRGVYMMLAKYAGPEFAEIIAHGLPRLAGVEASSRLGHDSLLFFGSPKSTRPEDIKTSIASVLLGAGGSTIEGLLNGSQHIVQAAAEAASGSYSRAGALARQSAREMIPIRQVADIFDAYRKSTGDMSARTRGGALLGPEYTTRDAFWRAMGFTPAPEARGQEQSRAERRVNLLAQTDRKAWLDRYATASSAERPTIEAGIREFNASQPATQRIGSADMVRAVAQRRAQERRPGNELGLPLNKRTRDLHREYSQLYITS